MQSRVRELLIQKTGSEWVIMDKALLEEVSRRHNISEDILRSLGEKNKIFDEVMATFSPRWKTDRDHFKLLASYIISLASQGNVIIVGRGSAIITAHLTNCHHFRLYGSIGFKSSSIAARLKISLEEASRLIEKKQAQRDNFTSSFLGRNAGDLSYYELLFNNDKSSTKKIACTISGHVLFSAKQQG
jgi:cytidylate kinase